MGWGQRMAEARRNVTVELARFKNFLAVRKS